MSRASAWRGPLLGAAVAVLLVACGGGGSELPTTLPSALPSDLPSDLPSELPSELPGALPTELPEALPTELPGVLPTELPSAERPSAPAVEEPTEASPPPQPAAAPPRADGPTPTEQSPGAPTVTSAAAPPTSAAAAPASPSEGSNGVWWLLGLLVVAAVVVVAAAAARRRRAASRREARLTELVAESAWLAHDLLPRTLSAPDPDTRRSTWAAYRPRVDTLVVDLAAAADAAPEDRRASVDRLRAAVVGLGSAMDTHTAAADGVASRLEVELAQLHLEESLRTAQQDLDSEPARPAGDRRR